MADGKGEREPGMNGGEPPDLDLDPAHPDLPTMAGVLVRTRYDVRAIRAELQDHRQLLISQGGLLAAVARAVGVAEGVTPSQVPSVAAELDKHRGELDSLHETDADVTEKMARLTAEAAEAKLRAESAEAFAKDTNIVVKANLPQLVKVGGLIVAGLAALTGILKLLYDALVGKL